MADPKPSSASSPIRTLPPMSPSSGPGFRSQPPHLSAAPQGSQGRGRILKVASAPFWFGMAFSLLWVGVILFVVMQAGPTHIFAGINLTDWAIGVSALASPVALAWMITAYLQRSADVQLIAEPLRRQLIMITGESGAAEGRIRRFNQAIKEQLELLRSAQSATQGDIVAIMDRIRHHRNELERFEHASVVQIKEIQDIVRRNMQHVEQMMDDKFAMMRSMDEKMVQNTDGLSRHMESMRDQVEGLLADIDSRNQMLSDALQTAQRESQKLYDTARAQESSLLAAAESASDILDGAAGKIDTSVGRFLERSTSAREEAERLAGAIDAQTRSLESFTDILPQRVSNAETVLRDVTNRLYASEKMAGEQAERLHATLANQADNIQGVMDSFTARLAQIDSGLSDRCGDLDSLGQRVSETTESAARNWEKSITDMSDRTGDTLLRFATLNDDTRRNADMVTAQLSETTARYEAAATQVKIMSVESGNSFKDMVDEVTSHLNQFELLRTASLRAGEELQSRATTAMQNLQFVLGRLLAARESTKSVGESLIGDLTKAVDLNESLIIRLNEAAQMSVHAMGVAVEGFGKQESHLVGHTKAAESAIRSIISEMATQSVSAEETLRNQTEALAKLLSETRGQIDATDQQIQSFTSRTIAPIQEAVRQIDTTADQGLASMGRFGEGLQQQIERMQQIVGQVGDAGGDVARVTSETLISFDQYKTRFDSMRQDQEETARQTLAQFDDMAARLQREVAGLDGQAAQAVSTLQQVAAKVGEQTYQVLQDSENAGTRMQGITTALQVEAAKIRETLQQQADDLRADLDRADARFVALGDALRERADSVTTMLDHVAERYNEATQEASDKLESRVQKLEEITQSAQGKMENLAATVTQQLSLIGGGSMQLETSAAQITSVGGKTLQQLSALNEKLTLTHEAANNNAAQTMARLEECNTSFMRQSNELADAAQTSVTLIQRAGVMFGEQSSRMLETSHQVDSGVRQMAATVTSLADQSTQIRTAMEQQTQQLLGQTTQAIAQMESAAAKLEQLSFATAQGTDAATARYETLTTKASEQLRASQFDLEIVAQKAESSLSAFGADVTQQAATLSVIGEQIEKQHQEMAQSSNLQGQNLVNLFDKMGAAHAQAADVADRTIARLDETLQQIQRQLGLLSDQSQTTVGNVRTASAGFADQAGTLLENAQVAEQQVRAVLSVTASLQDQARQLRESVQADTDHAAETLTALVNRIATDGIELHEFSGNTEMVLESLGRNVASQSQVLNGTMEQIEERQKALVLALDAQRDVINGLVHRLVTAQKDTADAAESAALRVGESAQQVAHNMESLDTKAQLALSSLQAASSGLGSEADSIYAHAQRAETQVRDIGTAVSSLQDHIRIARESLQTETLDASSLLDTVFHKMAEGGEQLRGISVSVEATMTGLQAGITTQMGEIAEVLQQLDVRQRSLTTSLEDQRAILNNLLDRFTTAQEDSAIVSEQTVQRLDGSVEAIRRQIETLDAQSAQTVSSLQNVENAFADETNALAVFAQQAEQQVNQMMEVSRGLEDHTRQLRENLNAENDRTSEAFATMLQGLSSGSNDLRDLGASTETMLAELQTKMATQVTSVGDTIRDITERQQALALSLGEQRDMLDGMLNRFALAQDETAATAERTAQRLAGGADQLAAQVENMDARAKSMLETAQTVRTGLATEAEALGEQAEEVGKKLHGVVAAAADMQEQSRALRGVVHDESAKVIADLKAIIEQIENASGNLSSKSGTAMQTMQQVAEKFVSLAAVNTETLQTQMATLGETSDQAAAKFANLAEASIATMEKQVSALSRASSEAEIQMNAFGQQFADNINLLDEANAKAKQQAHQLADTAEYATTRLVALRDTLGDSEKEGQAIWSRTLVRIDEVKDALRDELTHLSGLSQESLEQIITASESLAAQNDLLRADLTRSESALAESADIMRAEIARLPSALDRSMTQVNAATRALKIQAEDVEETLVGVADRFVDVSGATRVALEDEMRRIDSVAADAGLVLRQFGEMLAEQVATMEKNTENLSREQLDLVSSAAQGLTRLSDAGERIAQLRGDAETTFEYLAKGFVSLDKQTAETTQRLSETGDAVTETIRSLGAVAQEAESRMASADEGMRDQLQQMQLALQGQMDTINRDLGHITTQLERTGETLRTTTKAAANDVDDFSEHFEKTNAKTSARITAETIRMNDVVDDVSRMLADFNVQINELSTRIDKAGDGIRRNEGDVVAQTKAAIISLDSVIERLETGRQLATDVSDAASTRLGDVADKIQSQMHGLATTSQTAAGVMRSVGQIYADQSLILNRGVNEAHGQVLAMNKVIDDMQQRTDRMRVTLKLQGDELMNSLQQIMRQLMATGDAMGETVDTVLQEKASESLKKIS